MQLPRNQINNPLFGDERLMNSALGVALASGVFLLAFFVLAPFTHASQTNGTISTTYKYAWSDVGGYVNFVPTQSVVSVTDTGLSGYVWSENDGWINLSPATSGVTNNGNGTLGGFAWDPLKGWISFTGITIDASGKFHGKAVGANETISFNCTHCDVRTDWRPVSVRTPVPISVSSSGSIVLVAGTPGIANPLPGKQTLPTNLQNANAPSSGKQVASLPVKTSASASSTSQNGFISSVRQMKKGIVPPVISPTASTSSSFVTHHASSTASTTPTNTVLYVGGGVLILSIIFFLTRFLFV